MTNEQAAVLKDLEDKIRILIARHDALKKDFANLISEKEDLNKKVTEQNEIIEALEKQYQSAKMASGVLVSDEDKAVAKAEINRLVREMDNCIALLNNS